MHAGATFQILVQDFISIELEMELPEPKRFLNGSYLWFKTLLNHKLFLSLNTANEISKKNCLENAFTILLF
jgi:hypothetical protein